MNITVNTSLFVRKLRLVEKIVSAKSAIPILSNVLIRADRNEIMLSTTNLELSMTTFCAATVNKPGVITIPAKNLLSVMSQITEEQTHLIVESGKARIAAGAFKMRLQALDAEDFPTIPQIPEGGVLLPYEAFWNMIKCVRYAISDSDKRYVINGALLSLTDTTIALVATDSRRLSLTAVNRDTPGENFEIVIPKKAMDTLLLADGDSDILFHMDERHMFMVSEENILSSRRIEGKFPEYQWVIPKAYNNHALVPRRVLLAAINRVALSSGDLRSAAFNFEDNTLILSAATQEIGEATESLVIEYSGPPTKITLNCGYVIDFLTAAVSPSVKISIKGDDNSVLFTDGDTGTFINVIMPIIA